MNFLNPIAGIVAALIAVPLLVLLYFLKLRRRPLRVSSTLLWEQAGADLQVNVPFRWIKFSFMLLLQLATLLALLIALARPAIDLSRPTSKRVVILIDRSASMSAQDGPLDPASGKPITRLEDAKAKATETAISLLRSRGGEVLVAQFAARASVVQNFSSLQGDLTAAIAGITATDQPADLRAAMALLEPLALTADQPDAPSSAAAKSELLTVLILSDGGPTSNQVAVVASGLDVRLVRCGPPPRAADAARAAAAPSPASTPPSLSGPAPSGPGPAAEPSALAATALDRPTNRGIVAISAKRDGDDPATIRVFVRAISTARRADTAPLRLALDGRDAASATLEFVPTPGSPQYLQASATLSVTSNAGGVVTVSLPPGDALVADDQVSAIVSPLKRPRTLLVRPTASVTQKDVFTDILGQMEFASLAIVDALPPEAASGETADLLIFDRVQPPPGLRVSSIILDAGLPLTAGRSIRIAQADAATTMRPVAWKRTHPVLRYVGLDSLLASPASWLAIDTAPSSVSPTAAEPPEKIETLAEGPRGPIIQLVETPATNVRHVVVGFDLAGSNWQVDVSFVVFIANAIDFLTGKSDRDSGRSFTTNQEITVAALPSATAITLTGPIDRTIPLLRPASSAPSQSPPAASQASTERSVPFGLLERAGLYRATGAAPPGDALAVNLVSEAESSIVTSDTLDVISGSGDRAGTTSASASTGGPREVWHWFVLAALVLSTLEWLAFARTMRG